MLPEQSQIVIIGGGVIGTSVAWHLGELGVSDVVLLERGQLGCGTSWHAAGNVASMDAQRSRTDLLRYSGQLYARFEALGAVGYRRCGRVMPARTHTRMKEYEKVAEIARASGLDVEMLEPADIRKRIPVMRTDDLVGGIWSAGDGRVNPTDLVGAFARGAREAGIRIVEGVQVDGVNIEGGRVKGVRTTEHVIECEVAINCAGLWARPLGLVDGIDIPVYPIEDRYILTEPIEGVSPDMPTFRDPDGSIYGREEVGGLLLGCFDRNALTISPEALPKDFCFDLLNENWEHFSPYLQAGMHRFPALETAGVKTFLNGPESFTPDCMPVMGEVEMAKGYFVLAGLCGLGIATSGGMGRALAHLIVENDAGLDASQYALKRFSREQNDESWLKNRIPKVPSEGFTGGATK